MLNKKLSPQVTAFFMAEYLYLVSKSLAMKKYLFSLFAIVFFLACRNTPNKETATGLSPADSLLSKEENTTIFPAITDSSKLNIIQRDAKTIPYLAYKQTFLEEGSFTQPSFTQQDIDGDGNKEIVISSYTGGAHCCDVTNILARTADKEMKEVLSFMGGTYISKDTIRLSFFEALGYFHTCYACNVEYPGSSIEPVAGLRFANGKFTFLPSMEEDNNTILKSLQFLQSKGVPDKGAEEEDGFDDGTRKAYAFNIVAYYYNNARDLTKTKQLFYQYYTHKDKEAIWKDLAKYIAGFDEDIKKAAVLE